MKIAELDITKIANFLRIEKEDVRKYAEAEPDETGSYSDEICDIDLKISKLLTYYIDNSLYECNSNKIEFLLWFVCGHELQNLPSQVAMHLARKLPESLFKENMIKVIVCESGKLRITVMNLDYDSLCEFFADARAKPNTSDLIGNWSLITSVISDYAGPVYFDIKGDFIITKFQDHRFLDLSDNESQAILTCLKKSNTIYSLLKD